METSTSEQELVSLSSLQRQIPLLQEGGSQTNLHVGSLPAVVESLDQRRGDLVFASKPSEAEGSPSWIRLVGQQSLVKPGNRESGPGLNTNTYALQIGLDALRLRADSGAQTYAGPFVTFGQTSGRTYDATGSIRTGTTALQGYSMGLAFTHFQPNGPYVDTIIQGTRFNASRANLIQLH